MTHENPNIEEVRKAVGWLLEEEDSFYLNRTPGTSTAIPTHGNESPALGPAGPLAFFGHSPAEWRWLKDDDRRRLVGLYRSLEKSYTLLERARSVLQCRGRDETLDNLAEEVQRRLEPGEELVAYFRPPPRVSDAIRVTYLRLLPVSKNKTAAVKATARELRCGERSIWRRVKKFTDNEVA